MNKNIIKTYALNLNAKDVKDYALKEGINITDEEANLFISNIKEHADEILDGHGLEVIESIKDRISSESYNKLLELFNKYKKFID